MPFDTLRELDSIPGVGPATISRIYEYAKRKGVTGAGGTEVIFSPAPADASHLVRIAKEIDLAQKSVDIAIYSYSDAGISAALARATARGVKVRFVFNDAGDNSRQATPATTTSGKLESIGVNVRYINKIMHHKFMIVDGPRDEIARAKTAHLVTGSANWSSSAARTFDENTVIFQNQEELVLRFQREFDNMWAHSRDFRRAQRRWRTSSRPRQSPTRRIPDGAEHRRPLHVVELQRERHDVLRRPATNTVADGLVAGINSATRSHPHRLRPPALARGRRGAHREEARRRRRSTSASTSTARSTSRRARTTSSWRRSRRASQRPATCPRRSARCLDNDFLFGYQVGDAGIDVRYKYYAYRWDYTYAPQMHHKFMAVDGTTLYSGSYNLSDNAEHDTFENMMVLEGARARSPHPRLRGELRVDLEDGPRREQARRA